MPLSDEESIDRVNPFIQHDFFMPGTSRQVVDFAPHKKVMERVEPEEEYRSPMCDYGVMVSGRIGKTGNCPLSRQMYPGRNIQYEDDVSLRINGALNSNSKEIVNVNNHTMNNIAGVATLLLLIAVL
jgi:hypothetical protein